MKVNDENVLKRFIKRKVTFTTSLMIGFLITGSLVFAEERTYEKSYAEKNKTNIETSLIINAENKHSGLGVYNTGSKLEVNTSSGEIKVNNNNENSAKEVTVTGIEVFNDGSLLLGKKGTDVANIGVSTKDSTATGIQVYNGKGTKTQNVDINANNVNVSAYSKNNQAVGIAISHGNMKSNNSNVTINSGNTVIIAKDDYVHKKDEEDIKSVAIQVRDGGTLNIDEGHVTLNGENAINVGGNSKISINGGSTPEKNIVKINGDILFEKFKQIKNETFEDLKIDTTIDSDVTINLSNADSELNGNLQLKANNADGTKPENSDYVVSGLKLNISNGAKWNIQEGSNNNIYGNVVVKNGGIINNAGTTYVRDIKDNPDLGIQMQEGAILTGTGIIKTSSLVNNIENVITTIGEGNIINGSDLTLAGNVNMLDKSKLTNQGKLSTSGSILVGNGATFTNKEGAKLIGTTDDQKVINVTGGVAVNNGTIDLSGTNSSYAMYGNNADSTLTNNGTVIVDYEANDADQSKVFGGTGVKENSNTGKIQVNGYDPNKNGKGDKLALESLLLGEDATNSGMFLDGTGKAIAFESDSYIVGETTETDVMTEVKGTNKIDISKNGAIIKADSGKIVGTKENGLKNLNLYGDLILAKGNNANDKIEIENLTTNIAKDTKIIVGEGAIANFANGVIDGVEAKPAIDIKDNGTLGLKDMTVKGDIIGNNSNVNMLGTNTINGKIDVSNIAISNGTSTFTSNSSFGNTAIDATNGKLILDVAADGANALLTTNNNGNAVTLNGKFGVDTSDLTENKDIALGTKHDLTKAEFAGDVDFNVNEDIYKTDLVTEDGEKKNTITLTYNKELLSNYGENLNTINNSFQVINNKISQNAKDRAALADKVYAGTIYAETVRMAYDNSKLVENELVKINPEVPAGEWVANGKALFMKNQYDRDGKVASYDSEKESTGLLAVGEYGVNETTNVGLAFAGIKHKLDTDTGKADGDAFYFGAFAKKQLGNYRLNAGLGYELNKFDTDENLFGGREKYDANVYSAYVEGRYVKDLGDNLRIEPKLKLGYTYVDQDSIKDGTYDIGSQDISVFDTELGADFIKTVALKDGRLDGIFGLSYTLAYGDTDDEFTGRFYNSKAIGSSFNMMGAEIAERSFNVRAGLEVSKATGLFYNGGVTFKAGSDSYRDYGVTLGAGYKF